MRKLKNVNNDNTGEIVENRMFPVWVEFYSTQSGSWLDQNDADGDDDEADGCADHDQDTAAANGEDWGWWTWDL